MKVKGDFVTNSSSASFIMTFNTTHSLSLSEFKSLFNQYVESFKRNHVGKLRFWDANVIESITDDSGRTLFVLTEDTSMYNGMEDIPLYMRELMINHFSKEYDWDFYIDSFRVED